MLTEKDEMRRAMKARRAAAEDRPLRDEKIFQNFISRFGNAGDRYFVYMSFGSEADTHRIIAELMRRDKRVYLPRTKGKEMELVRYTGQPLVRGAFGIAEPGGEAEEVFPEVCVLPLLAADGECRRLGYGGGFYDRYLAERGKTALKVGICYDFQIVGKIPAERHDVPLDAIVTDARIFCRGTTEE